MGETLLINYSILPASRAKEYTLRNRANPIRTILSVIENKIIAAIEKGDGAIYWQFEGENMIYMHEIINELYKYGYTVRDSDDYEDSSFISIIISWL